MEGSWRLDHTIDLLYWTDESDRTEGHLDGTDGLPKQSLAVESESTVRHSKEQLHSRFQQERVRGEREESV